jgi:hypothetical protein
MTERANQPLLRCFRNLESCLREAAAESKLAYEFSANSYTYAAMSFCMAAEQAVAALRDVLEEQLEGEPQ